MTRINLIQPQYLCDQHLIAEIKEINQLAGSFRKSRQSKKGLVKSEIPSKFTLNSGHVKFFYDKGAYLKSRFELLKNEALSRGFNINAEFNDEWSGMSEDFRTTWMPDDKDKQIVLERILLRISQKEKFYRMNRDIIDTSNYIEMMKKEFNIQ